jgi:hypothetical protein
VTLHRALQDCADVGLFDDMNDGMMVVCIGCMQSFRINADVDKSMLYGIERSLYSQMEYCTCFVLF